MPATDVIMTLSEGAPVAYHSFDGDDLTLHPWAGNHVAVLAAGSGLDAGVMTQMVAALDAAYEVYFAITGREPDPFLLYEGRLSIAEVPTTFGTSGGALGYLGATGIEVTQPPFDAMFSDIRDLGKYDQALFYELGRNFWFYGSKLAAVDPFVTGYAIVNRFISMEVAGLRGGPFGALGFAEFKSSILDGLPQSFFSDGAYTLHNTLGMNVAPANPHGWNATDFAASLFYEIYQSFGFAAYCDFFRVLDTFSNATTETQVYTNFFSAASLATGFDFGFLDKPSGVTYVVGGLGHDRLISDGTFNPVIGGGGNDRLDGVAGSDRLLAGDGKDLLSGNGGSDILVGGLGRDALKGGVGSDSIFGGPGADLLKGGLRGDVLTGGDGRDTFVYSHAAESTSRGHDTLVRFDARLDRMDLTTAVGGVDPAIDEGSLASGTFNADLRALVDATRLLQGHAVLAMPDSGDLAGEIFLVIDMNASAGYQPGQDLVLHLVSGLHLSDIDVLDFI
jgi:hypothetical protein